MVPQKHTNATISKHMYLYMQDGIMIFALNNQAITIQVFTLDVLTVTFPQVSTPNPPVDGTGRKRYAPTYIIN